MNSEAHLDQIFGALAHSTRRAILTRLRQGEASVGELAKPHGMSLPAISRHLKVLGRAGLIGRSVDGKFRGCHLLPAAASDADAWLQEHRTFWTSQLDALDRYANHINTESDND